LPGRHDEEMLIRRIGCPAIPLRSLLYAQYQVGRLQLDTSKEVFPKARENRHHLPSSRLAVQGMDGTTDGPRVRTSILEQTSGLMGSLPRSGESYEPMTGYYRPLNKDNNEIRLLKIMPGHPNATIRCSIYHVSLDDSPSIYTALSYCWGDRSGLARIYVDDHPVKVTLNLKAALRQLRRQGIMWAWVDALCINQNNTKERSQQVLRIAEIYSRAKDTIAWLGAGPRGYARRLFRFLRILDSKSPGPAYMRALAALQYSEKPAFRLGLPIKALCALPYWRRTWIIQEIAMSPAARFQWGQESIPSGILLPQMTRLIRHVEHDSTLHMDAGYFSIHNLSTIVMKFSRRKTEHLDLCTCLSLTSTFDATDVRDKVFGVLALCVDAPVLIPSPDYGKSLDVVLREVTMNMAHHGKFFEVISLKSPDFADRHVFPSWIPDWIYFWNFDDTSGLVQSSLKRRLLINTYKTSGMSKPIIRFTNDGQVLVSRGYIFDTITDLGSSAKSQDQGLSFQRGVKIYGSEEMLYDAIWRTLLMNRTEDSENTKRPPPDYAFYFSRLWSKDPELYRINMSQYSQTDTAWRRLRVGNDTLLGRSTAEWADSRLSTRSSPNDERGGNFDLERLSRNLQSFITSMKVWDSFRRQLITTKQGYVGLGHAQAKVGDTVCLLSGCSVPVILRLCDGGYRVVGEAYIHGIMDGEAWEFSDSKLEEIFIY
jgi:hypothetical protein